MANQLRNLRLDEVSLVDNPANKSARVSLFKRDEPEEETEPGVADETSATADSETAGSPGESMPENQEGEMSDTDQDTEKRLGELETKLSSLKTEVEKHGLTINEADDGSVTVAKTDDETVTDPQGNTIRKSDVGEQQFAVLKSLRSELDTVKSERQAEQLAKAAESRWPNVAGESAQKGAIYGALSSIGDETTREAALKHLDSLDNMIASHMVEKGNAGKASGSEPMQKLDSMAAERAEKTNETREQAFAKVIQSDEGARLYDSYISERAQG